MAEIYFHTSPGDADLVPQKQHESDAAYDLRSARDLVIAPGQFLAVPTGVRLEMPHGFAAQVRPRSGLALRHGVTVLNSPGTIDAGYRGEVCAILINHGATPFEIRRGDRIAQLLFEQLPQVDLQARDALSGSDRGECGFGSTGRQ